MVNSPTNQNGIPLDLTHSQATPILTTAKPKPHIQGRSVGSGVFRAAERPGKQTGLASAGSGQLRSDQFTHLQMLPKDPKAEDGILKEKDLYHGEFVLPQGELAVK